MAIIKCNTCSGQGFIECPSIGTCPHCHGEGKVEIEDCPQLLEEDIPGGCRCGG